MKIDLQGWFHPEEGIWYQNQVKRLSKGLIVEIGCWKGLSTSYLAPVLFGKPQRLWCVDNWKGSKDQYAGLYQELLIQAEKNGNPVHIQFRENLKQLEIPHKILHMGSQQASKYFRDESCSLVFLDASHDGLSVKADLDAWWPKVQQGGILSGHDYSNEYPELINAVKEFSKANNISLERGPRTIYFFTKK